MRQDTLNIRISVYWASDDMIQSLVGELVGNPYTPSSGLSRELFRQATRLSITVKQNSSAKFPGANLGPRARQTRLFSASTNKNGKKRSGSRG